MVDTKLLEHYIKESGKRKNYLAKRLNMSIQCFRQKCTNKSDFKLSEVKALCRELGITDLDLIEKIFCIM